MEKRIEKIKKRIDWLRIELIHEGYLEGIVLETYKKELNELLLELKTLEDSDISDKK